VDHLELRAELKKKADDRATADWHKEKATQEAAALMAEIQKTDGITMTDAAAILGISRPMAYRILNGERSSHR
jgi:ABC-type sugar transport system substrate-binding protein